MNSQTPNNLRWVNIFHIYQPPHQTEEIVRKVTKESYDHILDLLNTYPRLKLTINIAGSLVELMERYGVADMLEGIKPHIASGRVELLGTACYHPLLPFIPVSEVEAQIEKNNEVLRSVFGDLYKPTGFWAPELAVNQEVLQLIEEQGFTWVVLDECHTTMPLDWTKRYKLQGTNLIGVFRNRLFSNTFPPEYVAENYDKSPKPYLVVAHDGELYGHWHRDDKGYYKKSFSDAAYTFLTVSEYLKELTKEESISIRPGSWATLLSDYEANVPFPLWNNPKNEVHGRMWKFAQECTSLVEKYKSDQNYTEAKKLLSGGFVSCGWWWAAAKHPDITTPLTWSPDEIEKVIFSLIRSVRALQTVDTQERITFEQKFTDLYSFLWKTHWEFLATGKLWGKEVVQ